jgi:hypothetical protein
VAAPVRYLSSGLQVPGAAGRIHGRTAPSPSHDCLCESADILVGAVLGAFDSRLEYRERVRRSRPSPLQAVQVWYEKFRAFLLPLEDTLSPKE